MMRIDFDDEQMWDLHGEGPYEMFEGLTYGTFPGRFFSLVSFSLRSIITAPTTQVRGITTRPSTTVSCVTSLIDKPLRPSNTRPSPLSSLERRIGLVLKPRRWK